MMSKYAHCPQTILRIDETPEFVQKERAAPRVRIKNQPSSRNPAARVLGSLGIEREMSDEIVKILESCNIDFRGEKKEEEKK
jgi:hypothetical protein